MSYEMAVIAGDFQIPFHSARAVSSWLQFLRAHEQSITLVVLNGDILDFPYLSLKFIRDPATRLRMKYDIAAFELLKLHINEAVPNAQKVYIMGNHEERWTNYVRDRADEMAWLLDGDLSLSRLLGISKDRHWRLISPYGEGLDWHGLFITHGTHTNPHSGYAARAEYIAAGTSGISGHTQRGGVHFHSDRSGAHAWYEGFCLCNIDSREGQLPPHHISVGIRNQQQGFLVAEWIKDKRLVRGELWNIWPVAMTEQNFLWSGKLYSPERV